MPIERLGHEKTPIYKAKPEVSTIFHESLARSMHLWLLRLHLIALLCAWLAEPVVLIDSQAPHTAHNNPTGFVVQRVFLQMNNTREIT